MVLHGTLRSFMAQGPKLFEELITNVRMLQERVTDKPSEAVVQILMANHSELSSAHEDGQPTPSWLQAAYQMHVRTAYSAVESDRLRAAQQMLGVACLLPLRRTRDRTAIERRPQGAWAPQTESLRLSPACSIKRRRF